MNNILKKTSSIIVFLLFSLLCSNSIIAQYSISGYVTDNERKPLDYFHAVLYDSKDSSLIVGGVFENGAFELSTSKTQNLYLEISYVGYSRKLKGLGIGKPTSPIFSVAADVIFVCNYLLSTVEKIAPSY